MLNMIDYKFAGIIPLSQFKKILNVDKIQFMQGKAGKRQFASTAVGTLFMAKGYKQDEPAFVAIGGPLLTSINGTTGDLAGTFWLCNSSITEGDLV